MYHYVYKLEHAETGEFYIGSRSSKKHPTIDSYLGSMKVWKPNKTKLKKTILKDDFLDRNSAILFESEEISKNIKNNLNRNYHIPQIGFHTQGTITIKDNNDNIFQVSMDDPRYLSGELKVIWFGRKHTKEAKNKMSISSKGQGIGESNSQYGTCWITLNGENKKIKKDDLNDYLKNGWFKGRILKKLK
jgi:hypothetical protein